VPVGSIGMLYEGDRTADAAKLARSLETVAEELDTVLASVQTAAEKHQLLVTINTYLSNRVFEVGMDGAVRALCEKVKLPGFLLLYRDAVGVGRAALPHVQVRPARARLERPALHHARRCDSPRTAPTSCTPNDKHLAEVLGERKRRRDRADQRRR
jgi:hypothetical protein